MLHRKENSADPAFSQRVTIQNPAILLLQRGEEVFYGGCQLWYPTWRGKVSGCGPTAAANLIWYLAMTRPAECGGLAEKGAAGPAGMSRLMEQVWPDVKPGAAGIYRAEDFVRGVQRYGEKRGVALGSRVLQVPPMGWKRPAAEDLLAFLTSAFSADLPVAFLNRSNGGVKALSGWHWVTLVSIDRALKADMYDQNSRRQLDLEQWLAGTKAGGAFVAIEPRK